MIAALVAARAVASRLLAEIQVGFREPSCCRLLVMPFCTFIQLAILFEWQEVYHRKQFRICLNERIVAVMLKNGGGQYFLDEAIPTPAAR